MSLFDIDIKQDGDKVVFDFTNETSRLMRGFHANLERLCKEDFDRFAAANGYVKADDYEVIAKRIDKEVIDCIADAHTRVEHLRDEDFDAMARLKGYIKLEPGQAVVPASALASAIRELRWLASSANLVSPGLWKEENSWTVSEFNNAIRAALEGEK